MTTPPTTHAACPRCQAPGRERCRPRDRTGGPPRTIRQCTACGLGYTDPPPTAAPAAPTALRDQGPLRAAADIIIRAELRPVTRAVPPGATLLDIGSGAGNRALQLARAGYRVTAVEPDPREADAARRQLAGHAHVLQATIRDIPGDTRYHAALLSHVLEHLHDPDTALGDIHARLAPRGTLIVMVPNAGGIEARTLRSRWHGWEPARHHRHHSRATLRRALLDTGYEDVTVTATGGWIHPATLGYSLAPGLDPQNAPPGRAFGGRVLTTLLAPVALAEVTAGLGPQLVATARTPA